MSFPTPCPARPAAPAFLRALLCALAFVAIFLVQPLPAQTSAPSQPASTSSAPSPSASNPTPQPKVKPQSAADINAQLQAEINKLPSLSGTGIDSAAQSKNILAHLNSMLRFYRTGSTALQKVGEPSDVLYAEQSQSEAVQITQLAFQAAKTEAMLLSKINGAPANVATVPPGQQGMPEPPTEAQRIANLRTRATQQLAALQDRSQQLDKQIASAKARDLPALRQQQEQVGGGIELETAMVEALTRVGNTNETGGTLTGLAGDIDRLQRSVPELLTVPSKPIAPPVLENLTVVRQAGVTSQAPALFQLLATRHAIQGQITAVDELRKQADDLRTPFVKVLRTTIQQGQALSAQAVNPAPASTSDQAQIDATRKQFDTLTQTFRVLSSATLPLSEEVALLEQDRGTLAAWSVAVDAEYKILLRSLLIRVISIGLALGFLAILSQVWSRATVRYVADVRRRRQLLLVRRIVIGFFTGLVLIFGFVTQFSSLATFAGFITAGIAVGLQTILLSVAAYFFIIGRYGVRVGDRITVAGVTGDVVEVGLVRFYLTELAGAGTELHPTGRVAVFANSVLFQTGTPLYKQMPGTEYGWHTLTVKLTPTANRQAVRDAVLKVVNDIYAGYRARIQAQQREVETWMGAALDSPEPQSRFQLTDSGPQLLVLFPVEIRDAVNVDGAIADQLVSVIESDEALKGSVAGLPVIQPSLK